MSARGLAELALAIAAGAAALAIVAFVLAITLSLPWAHQVPKATAAPWAPVVEDDPGWKCHTMGNGRC